MHISAAQYREMQLRLAAAHHTPHADVPREAATREVGSGGLHQQIINWCDQQHPRWKAVHSRTDKPSTTELGTPDFVVFGPFPKCLVFECKARTGKLTEDQRNWAYEMSMLGWDVKIVRSLQEFEALTIK